MQTLQIEISESDYQKYNFGDGGIVFSDLVEMISREYARKALLECNKIAEDVGLKNLSMEEIDEEIKAVRNAKNYS